MHDRELSGVRALIVGYGSIGKRHAAILHSMPEISEVAVYTSQMNAPYKILNNLSDILSYDPDYFVISTCTTKHHSFLAFIETNFKGKKVLVEKPLFDKTYHLDISNNVVFVGYNIRFHPLMRIIRENVVGEKIWSVHSQCCSYLPNWRAGRDYRESSSAKRSMGGGVLLDLSHEMDYLRWLFGDLRIVHAELAQVSDLEIETEDYLNVTGLCGVNARFSLYLNYFSKIPVRSLQIDGPNVNAYVDFLNASATIIKNGVKQEFDSQNVATNDTYHAQHAAVLAMDASSLCTYQEGLSLMRVIDDIRLTASGSV